MREMREWVIGISRARIFRPFQKPWPSLEGEGATKGFGKTSGTPKIPPAAVLGIVKYSHHYTKHGCNYSVKAVEEEEEKGRRGRR